HVGLQLFPRRKFGQSGEPVALHEADEIFDLSLFMARVGVARLRVKPVVALKGQVAFLLLRLSPDALTDRRLHVVDDVKARDAAEKLEGGSLPLEERNLRRLPKDAHAHRPAVAKPLRPKADDAAPPLHDGLHLTKVALHALT